MAPIAARNDKERGMQRITDFAMGLTVAALVTLANAWGMLVQDE